MDASSVRAGLLPAVIGRIGGGIEASYRDAFAGARVAWASPAIAIVGPFVAFWAAGLLVSTSSIGRELPTVLVAAVLGLAGLLLGLGLGWRQPVPSGSTLPATSDLTRTLGMALIAAGLVAMVLYFLAIGDIPLFRPGLEQARVQAAEEGGAPLRVLSMLAIPGCWLLVAWSAAARRPWWLVAGTVASGVVATGWVLTGNRAPAFQTVEVSLVVALLSAGFLRLRWRGVAFIAAIGLALVLAAGVFGAVRLASSSFVYGPPAPGAGAFKPDYPRLTQVAIAGYLRVPVQNLRYTMIAVPELIGWRLGATYLMPVVTILPGKQYTFDAELKGALRQTYAGGGTVPGFLGEAYANFGPAGWFFVPTLVGFLVTLLYRRATFARSPAWWALYGYAMLHVVGSNLSGLSIASIFPWEAYAVLATPILLPHLERVLRPPLGNVT